MMRVVDMGNGFFFFSPVEYPTTPANKTIEFWCVIAFIIYIYISVTVNAQ